MAGKYNGMKRAGDWRGKQVKTVRKLSNGWCQIPAGTSGHITSSGRNGLHFHSDPCPCCGIVSKISALDYCDVKLLDPAGYTMPTVRVREQADARIQEKMNEDGS